MQSFFLIKNGTLQEMMTFTLLDVELVLNSNIAIIFTAVPWRGQNSQDLLLKQTNLGECVSGPTDVDQGSCVSSQLFLL